jgi:hypothetical protein
VQLAAGPVRSAIAVLSPSTLLLSHFGRILEALTHTAPAAGCDPDSKLSSPVGALRVLSHEKPDSGRFATGIAVDRERRRIFVGDCPNGGVEVFDMDSGVLTAVWRRDNVPFGSKGWGSAADVARSTA